MTAQEALKYLSELLNPTPRADTSLRSTWFHAEMAIQIISGTIEGNKITSEDVDKARAATRDAVDKMVAHRDKNKRLADRLTQRDGEIEKLREEIRLREEDLKRHKAENDRLAKLLEEDLTPAKQADALPDEVEEEG